MELKAAGEGMVERLAYSPAEIAAAFGLSRRSIYRAIATGELCAARVWSGSRLLVPAEEIGAWVERNVLVPAPPPVPPRLGPCGGASRGPLRAALAELEPPGGPLA